MGFGGQLNQVMQNEKTSGHINIQLMFYKYFSSMNLKSLKSYLFAIWKQCIIEQNIDHVFSNYG